MEAKSTPENNKEASNSKSGERGATVHQMLPAVDSALELGPEAKSGLRTQVDSGDSETNAGGGAEETITARGGTGLRALPKTSQMDIPEFETIFVTHF